MKLFKKILLVLLVFLLVSCKDDNVSSSNSESVSVSEPEITNTTIINNAYNKISSNYFLTNIVDKEEYLLENSYVEKFDKIWRKVEINWSLSFPDDKDYSFIKINKKSDRYSELIVNFDWLDYKQSYSFTVNCNLKDPFGNAMEKSFNLFIPSSDKPSYDISKIFSANVINNYFKDETIISPIELETTRTFEYSEKEHSVTYDWEIIPETINGLSIVYENDTPIVKLALDLKEYTNKSTYNVKCTITDQYGNVTVVEKNVNVPKLAFSSYEEYVSLCESSTKNETSFIAYIIDILDQPNQSYSSLFVKDLLGNSYFIDTPKTGLAANADLNVEYPIGSELLVTGIAEVKDGRYQIAEGASLLKTGNYLQKDDALLEVKDVSNILKDATSIEDESLKALLNDKVIINNATIEKITGYDYYFKVLDNDILYSMNLKSFLMSQSDISDIARKLSIGSSLSFEGVVFYANNLINFYPTQFFNLTSNESVEYYCSGTFNEWQIEEQYKFYNADNNIYRLRLGLNDEDIFVIYNKDKTFVFEYFDCIFYSNNFEENQDKIMCNKDGAYEIIINDLTQKCYVCDANPINYTYKPTYTQEGIKYDDFIVDYLTFKANSDGEQYVSVKDTRKTINGVNYSYSVDLSGPGCKDYRCLSFNVVSPIQISLLTAPNNALDYKYLGLYKKDGTLIESIKCSPSEYSECVYSIIEPGEYYITSEQIGFSIYEVKMNSLDSPVLFTNLNKIEINTNVLADGNKAGYASHEINGFIFEYKSIDILDGGFIFDGEYISYINNIDGFSKPIKSITIVLTSKEGHTTNTQAFSVHLGNTYGYYEEFEYIGVYIYESEFTLTFDDPKYTYFKIDMVPNNFNIKSIIINF